jgi:hypothetical protein
MSTKPTEQLLDACADVVILFKGHGSYGTEAAALKALRRRVSGHSAEEYQAVSLCSVEFMTGQSPS